MYACHCQSNIDDSERARSRERERERKLKKKKEMKKRWVLNGKRCKMHKISIRLRNEQRNEEQIYATTHYTFTVHYSYELFYSLAILKPCQANIAKDSGEERKSKPTKWKEIINYFQQMKLIAFNYYVQFEYHVKLVKSSDGKHGPLQSVFCMHRETLIALIWFDLIWS